MCFLPLAWISLVPCVSLGLGEASWTSSCHDLLHGWCLWGDLRTVGREFPGASEQQKGEGLSLLLLQLPSVMGVLGGYPGLSSGASPRVRGTHSDACRRASGLPWTQHAAGPPSPRRSCCGGDRGIRESPPSCPQTQISSPGSCLPGLAGFSHSQAPVPSSESPRA